MRIYPAATAILLSLFAATTVANAQEDEYGYRILSPTSIVLDEPVSYLEHRPVIDGRLDEALKNIPLRTFNLLAKSDEANPETSATWRIAYGSDCLWLYIEAPGDRLQCRDRAWQNGDGFHMVIAAPRADNAPTDEFYVLACSAVDNPRMEWTRRVFWYYNVSHIFRPVSAETLMQTSARDGVIAFELLLPWKDIPPYHPWLSESIGFNLTFVRAIGERECNYYQVQSGEPGRENNPRTYSRLVFAMPPADAAPRSFARLNRATIAGGDTANLDVACLAPAAGSQTFNWTVIAGEGSLLNRSTHTLETTAGLSRHTIPVATSELPAGGYRIAWQCGADGDAVGSGLTILPPFDVAALKRRLAESQSRLSLASYETLNFHIDELAAGLATRKPYETSASQRLGLEALVRDFALVGAGRDPYAGRTGFLRKAYRSTLDGTLQPYCVNIPESFDPDRRYPLVVYLHGSASDETNLGGILPALPTDEFIALGPRGRGPSNCWSADNAQEDVAEAINAVRASYPIDDTRIILTGFSMGGYGVLRTHLQTPGKFSALAIFSGGPDIGPRWLGAGHPDFRDPANLVAFRDVPIFIFHGRQDRNVPFSVTEDFVGKLRAAGADVEFVIDPERGHERPGEDGIRRFRQWLNGR